MWKLKFLSIRVWDFTWGSKGIGIWDRGITMGLWDCGVYCKKLAVTTMTVNGKSIHINEIRIEAPNFTF